MKMAKKISSFLLAVMLAATSILPAAAFEKPENAETALQGGYASTQDKYAIYPIPQSEVYPGGEFTLGTNVQVVSESGIDEYTNAFLAEILEDYGRTKTESSTVGSGQKILLGIKGSGGAVDNWVNSNVTVSKTDLFQQTDSYLLSAKDGTIVILGEDTDAVYYGLATLQMMFSSFAGNRFLNVQIEDYAIMKMRGFIEGMYSGWSYEGRESLMRFGRDVKMNTYIYASKIDSYHKNDVLYPAADIKNIENLVKAGEETKVRYSWSVHISYFFNALSGYTVGTDAYNTAFNQKFAGLTRKFQQLYDAGVRKFAILNDDFGSGTHEEVVRLLNKLDDEFLTPKGCENLTYCMQGYNKSWSTEAELRALQQLNASIDLFWTGDDVNAPITQDTVNYVKEKTGHSAVYWLNYPVNEHAHSGIFLGNITHYARDGVTGLTGAVSNPSLFTEANKVGLFQLGCLFWNNKNYLANADTIWRDCFKYLQPEVYDAYLTLGKHIANCPGSSRVPNGFPESEDIREALETVGEKIRKGRKVADDPQAQMLVGEFAKIRTAIADFRSKCANETLKGELEPWLKSLDDIAEAGGAVLQAAFAIEKKDVDAAWAALGTAGQAMGTQDTYPTYSGSSNMARAGSKRLVPFVNKVLSAVKMQLNTYLNPDSTDFVPSFIGTVFGEEVVDSKETAKVFDGDPATMASWAGNDKKQQVDDYFGIDMGRILKVSSIEILQGADDEGEDATANNYFHHARLEYSEDGDNWQTIQDYEFKRQIREEGLDIQARYVRLRATEVGRPGKPDHWLSVREFTINGGKKDESEKLEVYTNVEADMGEVSQDGYTYSLTKEGTVPLGPGAYLGVQLKEFSRLGNIQFEAEGASGLSLQYSEDGVIWKDVPEEFEEEKARYVRLYNGTNQKAEVSIHTFEVTISSNAINPTVVDSSFSLMDGTWDLLFDGDETTYMRGNEFQQAGQHIIVDLGAEVPVYDVMLVTDDEKPRFYDAEIQVSTDKADENGWETIATVVDGGGDAVRDNIKYRISKNLEGKRVRYLRILITKDRPDTRLRLYEIAVNKTVGREGNAAFTGNLNGNLENIIDGDISTAYVSETVSDGSAYLRYKLTENTKLSSVSFLQDANAITNAVVKAEVYDETDKTVKEETLGTLNKGNTVFTWEGKKQVLSFTITWPEGTVPILYEIIMKAVAEEKHEIVFEADADLGINVEGMTVSEGKLIVLPSSDVQKAGYVLRWSDGAKTYAPGSYYQVSSEDVTLKTVWAKECKISFSGDGAGESKNVIEGDVLTLPENTYQKEGYVFKGWSDGTKTYAPGESYIVGSADVTLTAVWEKKPSSGENSGGNDKPTPVPTPQPTAPGAPGGLKATKNANTSISLSWSSVAQANGYIVSMYDTNTKAWKDVSLVGGTSYQVKGLKSATEYQFRVKAYKNHYGSRITGADSSILKTATSPAKTKLKVKKTGTSKVKLTWDKKAKADGFEISMRVGKKGKFKRIASKKKNVVSMTKKGMKKGKTYTFRLRSYKKVGSQKIYSAYTTKKIKIK